MTQCVLLKVGVKDLFEKPELEKLMADYAAEAKHEKTPSINITFDMYYKLEEMGMFTAFAAFEDGEVVGFIAVTVTVAPRFGVPMGMVDAFYVDPDYRKKGTGKKLLEEAERHAVSQGAAGVIVSAPPEGRLVKALPILGYTEINRVFYKGAK